MAESLVFLDNLIEQFYEPVGPDFRQTFERGQICWTHIGYTREDLQLWRPTGLDPSQTTVNSFRLEPAGQDAFRRNLPLHTPPLETNEEFVAVRAKRRPVILISPVPPATGISKLRRGGLIDRKICLVVPIYSLSDRQVQRLKYPAEFIERLRILEYPQFLFLPDSPGGFSVPSYARVGELQAVYQPHLRPENRRLCKSVQHILEGQIIYATTGVYGGEFENYREQLMNQQDDSR